MIKFRCILLIITVYLLNSCLAQDEIISCDFETDFCGFTPNEFVVRYQGKSPSATSGPTYDHTYGIDEGTYALCDARLLRDENDRCELSQTVTIPLGRVAQFQFWYHMYGFQIGTLELLADDVVLWSLTGRQADQWRLAQVVLPDGKYELKFSANRSTDGRLSSDIAIDDIMIEGQVLTTNFVTISRTMPAMVVLNVSDEFDDPATISWRSEYAFNDWYQMNGNLSDYIGSYGPGSDWTSLSSNINLTTNQPEPIECQIPYILDREPNKLRYYCSEEYVVVNGRRNTTFVCGINEPPETNAQSSYLRCQLGQYLMITSDKFSSSLNSLRSRLYSPVFVLPEDIPHVCFTFKYNIHSSGDDGFYLGLENFINPSEQRILFVKAGSANIDKWQSAQVDLLPFDDFDQNNRLFFQPFRGSNSNEYASISIDSVHLYLDECNPTLEATTIEILPTFEQTTQHLATTESPETTKPITQIEVEETTHEKETTTHSTTEEVIVITTNLPTSTLTSTTTSTSTTTFTSTSVQTTEPTTEAEKPKESDATIYIIIGVVGGVVLLGAIGGGVYFYISKKKKKVEPEIELENRE